MRHPYRLAVAATMLSLMLGACSHSSNVTTQSAGAGTQSNTVGAAGTVLVKAGTTFYGKLQQTITSNTTPDGTTFQLVHVNPIMHHNAALDGTTIDGHVANVTKAGLGKKPGMTVFFDDIAMPDGTKVPIDVKLVSMKAFNAKSHHLRTLGMMAGGAVAGHMAAGRHHGGMMGAAGGYVLSQEMKTNIDVKRGTVLEVRFLKDATAPTNPKTAQ